MIQKLKPQGNQFSALVNKGQKKKSLAFCSEFADLKQD